MSNKDFFTSVPFSGQQGRGHSTDQENVASFAHAIAARFGSADLLTARILPDEQQSLPQNFILPPKPILPPPSKPVSSSSSSSSTFIPVNPSDLAAYLADPSILILDIRPHAAHTAARIHRALSLSIPSTLIKRPLFGLSKLIQMLPSSSARARFAAWPTANHILVYDADSVLVPDTSNIAGLFRKFRAEGFTGELAWVKGGFQAVWRDARHCATTDHPSPDEDDPEGTPSSGALRTKHLPKAAFSLSTTTAANAASGTPAIANAANPFFDTIRQNLELSQGITERIPLRLPRRVRRRIKDLPFRWLQDIAGRSAIRPSHSSPFPGETSVESGSESSDDPHESDPDSNDPDVEEGAETLAMQFYRIELAEQRRLRSVMEHHARESEVSVYAATGAFPFSITAGVEKGAKNRYNHIWPFEHARVRLHDVHTPRDPSPVDDYVNASYVQPLGTRKRYIATQGPLPATFVDFWTLVWEQNVHVIVMLTREIENAMVKCGTYWVESSYGPLQLQLLDTSPPISPSISSNSSADIGFFMSPRERDKGSTQPTMIVRTFALSHRGYPGVPPRKVTHLQYLDWPDMNVPDDPRGVLELMKRVERAVQESTPGPSPSDAYSRKKHGRKGWRHPDLDSKTGIAAFALGSTPPVLLHCSAGVGRTGGFIAVDAVLDAIKRELNQRRELKARAQARACSGGIDVVANQVKEKEMSKEKIIGTVPLVMGDRKKSRRHYPHKAIAKEGETSSSESLVVHVPFTGNTADLDTRWQNTSSSTREWAEKVLDQTHPGEEEQETELPPPLPLSIGRSGSGSGSSGSSSISGSGSGGPFPPSSCVSISHSSSQSNSVPDSISASNSGSGANTSNSGFWGSTGADSGLVGLMRARLRDSSVTSLSNLSSDFSSEKLSRSLAQPSAVRIGTEEEDAMDVDRPPRSPCTPLQPANSGGLDQRTAGCAVIDYKLPRQLHQDLSPAPLMSHTNPIWTVVQDMREQRMSLCQSLRQYVFVHAAVIEGALMIMDEERELWGECTGSESSPELVSVSASGSQMHHTSSSPSKWKRGPSPTELLREDKSGTISFAKRPSIKPRTFSDEKVLTVFELAAGAPQVLPGGTGGVSKGSAGMGPMTPAWSGPSATAR
ncbi:uncharacterized protein F5891DRAFT_937646 [Suillus fuscotomentosus]|uniref:protein-tyrosine-phosphatase n=1 Tax=Suillus fuscotomentosus TaxID=1912939 RepID=A0AAD4ELT4_9AGAM|nr:uncharacterized protein F5891DRAFT_937646 [Suillus fuscotomentosus]KAG1908545.1 hypothetical protein F5891DRAFT_937646 [Suillus fuscotomentosus]